MRYDDNNHSLNYKFNYNLDEITEIKNKIKNEDLSINNIRQIALWKYNRIINIQEDVLKKLNETVQKENINIHCEEVKDLIEDLIKCKGVGMPLASTILKFLRPDIFPIIDVRAYRAVFDKKINKYTYSEYIEYCKRIYEISKKTGINLNEIDEQLYEFDKQYNGKI